MLMSNRPILIVLSYSSLYAIERKKKSKNKMISIYAYKM
jgi:hypothetical protein